MCVGIPYWARSTRDRPSADTGRVREIEGAGQLSLKQEGSWVGLRLAGRLTMRLWWGLPDRSNRQSQAEERAARAAITGVAMGVASKCVNKPVPE